MAAGKLLEVLVAARKLVVVEVAAEELKPKRLLPVVDVAKDVPAKGVFPVSATEVWAAEAEFGADPKLKTGASIDVEKADAGTDIDKTELASGCGGGGGYNSGSTGRSICYTDLISISAVRRRGTSRRNLDRRGCICYTDSISISAD